MYISIYDLVNLVRHNTFFPFQITDAYYILGKYQYSCPKCDKEYYQKHSLYIHLKYDCGKDAPFKCGLCTYRTKRRANLKRHMHQHSKLVDTST